MSKHTPLPRPWEYLQAYISAKKIHNRSSVFARVGFFQIWDFGVLVCEIGVLARPVDQYSAVVAD
jgi:hypothetical protein